MFKRILACLILASMIIHCAGRLGLLDSLYQQRHRIVYHLGLIAEIPIAMCSGEYDFDGKLNFQSDDQDESGAPVNYQPREITLFFVNDVLNFNIEYNFLSSSVSTHYSDHSYKSPDRAIFQPPKL